MSILNNIFLWAAIIIAAIALYKEYDIKYSKKKAVGEIAVSDRLYKILFIITAVIAVFIRIYKFGSVPGGFNQDGAMAAVDAKALAEHATDRLGMHLPVHLTAWGYGQMSALLSYLMIPFVKIGGLSAVTARLPQLIVSLAGLTCLYLFVKDTFGKIPALIAFMFAAINPWHIIESRWALDCNLYPHFFIMGIYFLNKGLKRLRYLVISMVMFGLCMYCYGISIYTMPLFLAAVCAYLLITKKITVKRALIALAVYLVIAMPFILTMAINFFKLDTIETPFFTIPYFPNSVRSNDILFFSDGFFKQLASNAKSLLNITLLQKKDLPWNDIEGFGTMYLFTMPFFVLGLISLIKDYRKNTGAVLILMFLATGIWCGLTTNGVNVNRLNIIYYPIMLVSAFGILFVVKQFKLSSFGIAAAYITAFAMLAATYFTSYARDMEYYFFKDFGKAVEYVADIPSDKVYITADSQYEGSSNVSEILTLFYQDIDAEYYRSQEFKNKYTFESIKNIRVNPNENAVYVVTKEDIRDFNPNNYEFKQFGSYYAVTKK